MISKNEKNYYTDSVLDSKFKQLEKFMQQRSHLVETVLPSNTVGIDGEMRILAPKGGSISHIVKVNGVWKQSGFYT
jgi:hypothetical protein